MFSFKNIQRISKKVNVPKMNVINAKKLPGEKKSVYQKKSLGEKKSVSKKKLPGEKKVRVSKMNMINAKEIAGRKKRQCVKMNAINRNCWNLKSKENSTNSTSVIL
ncbi:hypothetical protein RIR_jg29331.t1 [Rhizophagus irregularis DAOM 181602=DAOM 197198]|nr:hypothetical protein RIR_jg29331.t1 [Rhizophagus irregularis DAOM 181602=DAOM 197198]